MTSPRDHSLAVVSLLVAVAIAPAGCRRAAEPPAAHTATANPAPPAAPDRERILVDHLSLLAIGNVLPEAERVQRARDLAEHPGSLDGLVDALLHDPHLGATVGASLLLADNAQASYHAINTALSHVSFAKLAGYTPARGAADAPVYYLHDPCPASDVVSVEPWWAPSTRVWVCADSYRPTVSGDGTYRCGSAMIAPYASKVCGCGPYLAQCARDDIKLIEAQASLRNEVIDTIADTINHDRPMAQIFLRKDSVREPAAEIVERRWRLMAGEHLPIADLLTWPAGPDRRGQPRREAFPGHHAGILSTPFMLYRVDAPRTMVRVAYEIMWCQEPASANVTTSAVLGLHALNLRQGEGWKELAAMPICTTCHARLDYGVQFFSGFPTPLHGVDYWPALHKTGRGTLYNRDIDDPIGAAALTPHGFAAIATAQPAFARCMVRRVAEHVFGDQASAEDRAALGAEFAAHGTFRGMMRVALLRFAHARLDAPAPAALLRFAHARLDAPALTTPPATTPATAPSSSTGDVVFGTHLRELVDDTCNDCHDRERAGVTKLSTPTLPRDLVSAMLTQVAFHGMPKDRAIPDAVRTELIRELAAALWPNPADRAEPLAFHEGGMRAIRVHRPSAIIAAGQTALDRYRGIRPHGLEETVAPPLNQYTPGFALEIDGAALILCNTVSSDVTVVEHCLDRLTATSLVGLDE